MITRHSHPWQLRAEVLLLASSLVLFSGVLYLGSRLVGGEAEPELAAVPGAGPGGATAGPVQIAAKDLAFSTRVIKVARGSEVEIVLDNQDTGILHNVSVYTTRAASTRVFQGELFAGPDKRRYTFTAPGAPGNYFFRCDVHPDQMTGTFIVQ